MKKDEEGFFDYHDRKKKEKEDPYSLIAVPAKTYDQQGGADPSAN